MAIKAGLVEVCECFAQPGEESKQVIRYLLTRMELFDNATMYKQTLATQYLDSNSPLIKTVHFIDTAFYVFEG